VNSKDQTEKKTFYRIAGLNLLKLVPSLLRNPLPTLVKLSRRFGHTLTFDAGKYQQIHVISDPEIVKHILKTNAPNYLRSPVIQALKPLLGEGIFIAEKEQWKQHHHLLKPAIHDDHIASYLKVVDEELNLLTTKWKVGNVIDVEPEFELLMLRILVQTMFGIKGGLDYKKILESQKSILNSAGIEQQKLAYFKKKIFGQLNKKKETSSEKDLDYLKSVADTILEKADKNSPLMSHLLGPNSDDQMAIDMILNLIFAGYDTTASALSWTIHCLSKDPNWQDRIVNEHDANESASVKMVLQEAMRIYPPVWSILRQSIEQDSILGLEVDKGAYMMICIHSLHRHNELWDYPDSFYPEHFASANLKGRAFLYIPFGQGQRMCIGKPLAMQELEYLVPQLLAKFVFEPANSQSEVGIKPDIITKSKNGIKVKITSR
jgi:cytochrome P450